MWRMTCCVVYSWAFWCSLFDSIDSNLGHGGRREEWEEVHYWRQGAGMNLQASKTWVSGPIKRLQCDIFLPFKMNSPIFAWRVTLLQDTQTSKQTVRHAIFFWIFSGLCQDTTDSPARAVDNDGTMMETGWIAAKSHWIMMRNHQMTIESAFFNHHSNPLNHIRPAWKSH